MRPNQQEKSTAQNLAFLRASFLRWWKLAIPLGVILACGAVAVVTYVLPKKYESTATLRIRSLTPYIAFQNKSQDRSAYTSTQLGIMRTRSVLDPAAEAMLGTDFDLPKDVRSWLDGNLQAKTRSELVSLAFTADSAELANAALNAILNSYLEYAQIADAGSNDRVIELLAKERDGRKATVEVARDRIREEAAAAGVVLNSSLGNKVNPTFTAIERMFISAEVEVEVLEAKLAAEEERVASGEARKASQVQLNAIVNSSSRVAEIKKKLADEEAVLEQYISRLKNPNASSLVEKARLEVEDLRTQLQQTRQEIRNSAVEQYSELSDAVIEERLRTLQEEVAAKSVIRDRLAERVRQRQAQDNIDALDVEFARAELARQEDIFERISSRIVALQTERAAPDRVTVIDRPTTAIHPKPINAKIIAMVGGGAFVLPIVICLGYDRLVERVDDRTALESTVGLHVVGETALLPEYAENTNDELIDPFRVSVGNVATILQLSGEQSKSQVVSVLSSVSGEGKTSLSTQLAISMAQTGRSRTLLIELDLQAPDMRHLLGLEKAAGIAQVLTGEKTLEETIQRDVVPQLSCELDVLSAGLDPVDALPLNPKALESIIAKLREQYDRIVIDTSPLLSTNAALPIACLSDVNLLCTMKGRTKLKHVSSSVAKLDRVGAPRAEIVVNGVTHSEYYSQYGRYTTHSDAAMSPA